MNSQSIRVLRAALAIIGSAATCAAEPGQVRDALLVGLRDDEVGARRTSPRIELSAAMAANPALTDEHTVDRAGTGPDANFGWGRVNACRAILAAEPEGIRQWPLVPIHTGKETRLH